MAFPSSGHPPDRIVDGVAYADVGCGFDARLAMVLCEQAADTTVVDFSIAESVQAHPGITAIEGALPAAIAELEVAFDALTCISVLEHVWHDLEILQELGRVPAPWATMVLNVPSWWGKTALEFSALRLRLSPASEMNDHKR